ncbi:MAG: amidohydrolase family protein [Candidatus Omnitrophota bacterium]
MKLPEIEKRLLDTLGKFQIIDCHEHLPPEKVRMKTEVDFFTLFSQYTHWDLLRAGMSEEDYQSLFNRKTSLDIRWEKFAPYWKKIRWTSYSRAVLITVKKFFGAGEINEKTYSKISDAIKKTNKPGLYAKILRNACNIKTCLTQCGTTETGTDLLTPVMPMQFELENRKALSHPFFEKNGGIKSLNDYLDAVGRYVLKVKSEGAVGLKMVSLPYGEPNQSEALRLFKKIKSGKTLPSSQFPNFLKRNSLRDYITDWTIRLAGEQNLVIAVHTGYWGDFRNVDPLHMIPLLQRHPNVRFDIYHAGYPWVRETLMLGKGFSNVWLNFCWTHIISQRFAMAALDEALDLVPINKILAFGGDYGTPVEKVYGHLQMAREDIAKILAKRINENQMKEAEALKIAHQWFWENPKELYHLKV